MIHAFKMGLRQTLIIGYSSTKKHTHTTRIGKRGVLVLEMQTIGFYNFYKSILKLHEYPNCKQSTMPEEYTLYVAHLIVIIKTKKGRCYNQPAGKVSMGLYLRDF